MSTWVNIDRIFIPFRALQLEVGWKFRKEQAELAAIADNPLALEQWVKSRIDENCPQFSAAVVTSMFFDPARHSFVFLIQHPDLHEAPPGEMLPREPLMWEPGERSET